MSAKSWSVPRWSTTALFVLIGCIACRRGSAQESLQITVRPVSYSLAVGDTVTVRAVVTVSANEAPVTVVWSSDNDAIAHVDRSGHVTARAAGITGISARIGTAVASTRVSVFPGSPRSADNPVAVPRVEAVASAPRPRPTSESGKRGGSSPHFSHISLFYTDFYSSYASPADQRATVSFLGARLDGVMSGPRDQWKAADPTILHFPYALQFTIPSSDQNRIKGNLTSSYFADMQGWYAAHPQYEFENAFLHRGGHDAAHRVQVKIWDSMRYAVNPGDVGQRAYQVDRLQRVAEGENGVFLDEFGGGMSGVSKGTDEFATFSAYMSAETELIQKVHDAIKPKFLLINIGEYWTPTDSALVVAGGGAHLERTNFPFTDRLVSRWTQIDNLLAMKVYTEFVTLWSYTDWVKAKSFPTFQGGMYSSRLERGQIVQLASYYMVVPADPARLSLDQQNQWNVRPDTAWMPAVEVDVGHPREARRVIASGTDAARQRYQIYARNFDHALVVIRPQSDWRPQIYADSTGIVVPLPSPMRPLRRDGTLGAAVSSVTLRNVEAAILFK
jgi:Bacterial Ig-like domain (group 2)